MSIIHRFNSLSLNAVYPDDDDYTFDAFFIYKTDKETSSWVQETCRELQSIGIECGYHERDFKVGTTIPENMNQVIKKSRKIVIVLTPGFNKSRWCHYDLTRTLDDAISKGREDRLIPLFLNVTEDDIPPELGRSITGLDVSGNREDWWDRLVLALNGSSEDETQAICNHYRRFRRALAASSFTSALASANMLQGSTVSDLQYQIGPEHIRDVALKSVGVNIKQNALELDFAKLFPTCNALSKLHPLKEVFRELCTSRNVSAALCSTDNDRNNCVFTPDSEMKIYGINDVADLKLTVSFASTKQVCLYYGTREIVNISLQSKSDTTTKAAVNATHLQLRSKRSQKLRYRLMQTNVQKNPLRGCRNYRNYRKLHVRFPDSILSTRYTFSLQNFLSNTWPPG